MLGYGKMNRCSSLGRYTKLRMGPVKIVKPPDGSLNQAALADASLVKERRELRQQEANDQADAEARGLGALWLDFVARGRDRTFARDLRGNILGRRASEVPWWKHEIFNKATTFGKITSLNIIDQRKVSPFANHASRPWMLFKKHSVASMASADANAM